VARPDLHLAPQDGAGAVSGLSTFILYLFLFVLAAVVVGLLVLVVRRWVPRVRRDEEDEPVVEIEAERSVGEWRADAEAAEAEGRWKDAVRARFRELVGRLVEQGVADPAAGRTTGELRVDVDEHLPDASAAFDRAALVFELAWYADVPCEADDLAALRSSAGEVLAAADARRRTEVPA